MIHFGSSPVHLTINPRGQQEKVDNRLDQHDITYSSVVVRPQNRRKNIDVLVYGGKEQGAIVDSLKRDVGAKRSNKKVIFLPN